MRSCSTLVSLRIRNEIPVCPILLCVAGGRPSRSAIYRRLDEAITDLKDRLGGLPSPAEADGIWASSSPHSTALEGNTLILSEVQKLLDEGRAVGDKELPEYMEVLGYGAAAKWVYGQALEPGGWSADGLLTLPEVRSVHFQAMTPVWNVAPHPNATPDESPGNWRRHEIAPFPDGMTPPPFTEIDPLIADPVRSTLARPPRTPRRLRWGRPLLGR